MFLTARKDLVDVIGRMFRDGRPNDIALWIEQKQPVKKLAFIAQTAKSSKLLQVRIQHERILDIEGLPHLPKNFGLRKLRADSNDTDIQSLE